MTRLVGVDRIRNSGRRSATPRLARHIRAKHLHYPGANRRRSPARTFSYCKGRFFPSPTEVTLATVTASPPPRKSHEKHHPLAMRRAHWRHHLVEGIRGLLRAMRAIALLQGRSSSSSPAPRHGTCCSAQFTGRHSSDPARPTTRSRRRGKQSLRLWRDCSCCCRSRDYSLLTCSLEI